MLPKLNQNTSGGAVVVTTDGGAGSSGKGALNAWLADNYQFHVAINNWMPNAGHFVELPVRKVPAPPGDEGSVRILYQHIPSAFINPNILLYISAGAAISIDILMREIHMLEGYGYSIKDRLTIHPCANVITEGDIEQEKQTVKSGSTFKGCGAASAHKTMRTPGRKLARDYDELAPFIGDLTKDLATDIFRGTRVLVEGSQGIDLDLNFGEYPFTTSRQTHPTQLVADAGLPPNAITNVIVNFRTNPIRISNESAANGEHCYTGNYWDAKEISWDDVAIQAGYTPEEFQLLYGFALQTSVTKKLRRVFEWPKKRVEFIHALCGGCSSDDVLIYSLNFVNWVDRSVAGATDMEDLMKPRLKAWIKENFTAPYLNRLKFVRTGPMHPEMVAGDFRTYFE